MTTYDPARIAAFWSNVDIRGHNECWPWKGAPDGHGYGRFTIAFKVRRKAHRIAFELHNGSAPKDHACHSCDNPPCCNPAHLFDGTPLDNMHDMISKGREKHPGNFGKSNGNSKFSDDDVRDIKRRTSIGQETLSDIARSYNVTAQAISMIKRGKNWRWIE